MVLLSVFRVIVYSAVAVCRNDTTVVRFKTRSLHPAETNTMTRLFSVSRCGRGRLQTRHRVQRGLQCLERVARVVHVRGVGCAHAHLHVSAGRAAKSNGKWMWPARSNVPASVGQTRKRPRAQTNAQATACTNKRASDHVHKRASDHVHKRAAHSLAQPRIPTVAGFPVRWPPSPSQAVGRASGRRQVPCVGK